jgi:quaternary ammonium compound-resistance protein SugE
MAWLFLFLAGMCEMVWPLLFKSTKGFTNLGKNGPIIALSFSIQIMSFFLMSRAIKSLPVGTVYAVWTGLGTTGIAICGMLIFHEPRTVARIVFLFMIVTGIVGLRFFETPPV